MAVNVPKKQPGKKGGPKQLVKLGLFWAIIIFLGLALYAILNPAKNLEEVSISDVINRANKGEIARLEIQGNDITVTPKGKDAPTQRAVKEAGSIREQGLKEDAPVEVKVVPVSSTDEMLWNLAIMIVPVVIIVAFFMVMMRQAQGQNNQAMGFGKQF